MTERLKSRIAERIDADTRPEVAAFAVRLAREAGAAAALFYGSNLRTGELEGVLDFYLLVRGPQTGRIWPRVSYHEWKAGDRVLRAKVATMALETFERACRGESRDTTIWARFVQPSALVHARDDAAENAVVGALSHAAMTAARFAAALGPQRGSEADYWRALFRQTYRAEFRVEKAGREDSILTLAAGHFQGLLTDAWAAQGIAWAEREGVLEVILDGPRRRRIRRQWRRRRRWGKPLNIARLVKASTTFEGAARYAAWKLERHTGVAVPITPWKEKHPLLAAPAVLFSIWREKRRQ